MVVAVIGKTVLAALVAMAAHVGHAPCPRCGAIQVTPGLLVPRPCIDDAFDEDPQWCPGCGKDMWEVGGGYGCGHCGFTVVKDVSTGDAKEPAR